MVDLEIVPQGRMESSLNACRTRQPPSHTASIARPLPALKTCGNSAARKLSSSLTVITTGIAALPPRRQRSRDGAAQTSLRSLGLAELLAQLVLRSHQDLLARGRSFQRCRDPIGVARREDALVEGQRIAVLGHAARPPPAGPRARRRPGGAAFAGSVARLAPSAAAPGRCGRF